MIKKYFKCTLLADIVINASLATEGNLKTLDYIPGSNFLGIVAGQLYSKLKDTQAAYEVFHSGKVSFGDAHVSMDGALSYPVPFALFSNKLKEDLAGDEVEVWVHHVLEGTNNWPKDERGNSIQLQQQRSGYLNPEKRHIRKVEKRFALKSAQDRTTRKSLDEAMFGFESMKKGQEFIFSVDFEDSNFQKEVTDALVGLKNVGKSKTAQYGQVKINVLDKNPNVFIDGIPQGNQLVIYAESNLCFFNEYGQPTFQPTALDFGLEGKGNINWAASQIRTYSYSPWNFYRGTTDTQRDCILKGSVIVFDFTKGQTPVLPSKNKVGAYQAEGLGRVIYNPEFLKADAATGLWSFKVNGIDIPDNKPQAVNGKANKLLTSDLGKFLGSKRKEREDELNIGIDVQEFITQYNPRNQNGNDTFKHIPPSQWGRIREIATQPQHKNIQAVMDALFGDNGALTKGVAAERYWNKQKGKSREILKNTIENYGLGIAFVAKLASEMAKLTQPANDN